MTVPKRRDVIITKAAFDDLTEIAAYVALDSLRRADQLVDELERKCFELSDRPLTWPLLADPRNSAFRRRLHAGYLIVYLVSDNQVEIVRIIHSARDYPSLLFKD